MVDDHLTPDPAIEFTVALFMAYVSALKPRQRLAFITAAERVLDAYAHDDSVRTVRTRHQMAMRAARAEAREWFAAYLPAFLSPP